MTTTLRPPSLLPRRLRPLQVGLALQGTMLSLRQPAAAVAAEIPALAPIPAAVAC